MAGRILLQGTASRAGVGLVAAGLCRILKQHGLHAAPFISLAVGGRSAVTPDGGEVARTAAVLAEASGCGLLSAMNPIFIKSSGREYRIIFNGIPQNGRDRQAAAAPFLSKDAVLAAARQAYSQLAGQSDVVVIASDANPTDPADYGFDLAVMPTDAPVILVADARRGGTRAALAGTLSLLPDADRARVKGVIVNAFPGGLDHAAALRRDITDRTGVPVLGIIPWREEFSVSAPEPPLDVAMPRLPNAADYRDAAALDRRAAFGVRCVDRAEELGSPDLILLPDSADAADDTAWLGESGIDQAVKDAAAAGVPVVGVGGGGRILGVMPGPGSGRGDGRIRVSGTVLAPTGIFSCLAGTVFTGDCEPFFIGEKREETSFAVVSPGGGVTGTVQNNVLATGVCGLFETEAVCDRLAEELLRRKGVDDSGRNGYCPERMHNARAELLREYTDVDALRRLIVQLPNGTLKTSP